ncbi:unnamed protein product, partial [Vitis vinifera]|uniref:Uncharacterized protein n=1 Tax=Vitis vinifera TaxID=29760 RepID=D7UCZ7_VITVI
MVNRFDKFFFRWFVEAACERLCFGHFWWGFPELKGKEKGVKKDLEEKKKRNFCLIWKKEKEIVITGFAWILQKENQSHLKLRNTSQRVVLSRYVSNYSQNSCLYSIPHSGCFGIFNVLLIGVDEKGHKLLG